LPHLHNAPLDHIQKQASCLLYTILSSSCIWSDSDNYLYHWIFYAELIIQGRLGLHWMRVFTDSASQGPAPRHRSLGLWCWIKGYSNFLFTALIFFIDLGSQVLYMNNWFDLMKYMAEEIRKWFLLSIISSYCKSAPTDFYFLWNI
jgi:hypothetical protein